MKNKIMSAVVAAAALTMTATLGTAPSASADVVTTKAGHIKSVHKTYAQCQKAGFKYSGDQEYWECEWDSPFWALWVLK
ncbi:hypothetical protein [Nonomuraea guangzhouensis]|uniref:Uncharacterized protein n=1 Tax=Nonomuraea guangzhouensis TaxID=1291555 RepID=A0ABW4GQX4_9ACTN|nr:hypothetical protein [Nonomuraea guangzhouensis]